MHTAKLQPLPYTERLFCRKIILFTEKPQYASRTKHRSPVYSLITSISQMAQYYIVPFWLIGV